MSAAEERGRLQELETENSRLRHLLHQRGAPSVLRHQVRNALGMMRSILRRSAESKATVEDFAAHLEGRFDALLRVQTMLLASPDEQADLYALVSNELVAHAVQDGGQATLDGPPVRLPPRAAELLGLVTHELVTNAVKFGPLTTPSGRIDVAWTITSSGEERRLHLTWEESGGPRLAETCPARGFGREVIEDLLPYQLKAESVLQFRPEGLRVTVGLPLPPEGSDSDKSAPAASTPGSSGDAG